MFAVAFGAQAAPAAAQGEPDTGAFNAFNLKGSNGYRMIVWAGSKKGYRHGEILIVVFGKRGAVTYYAPAKVTDTRVDADLGPFGEIDVTFQPSGERGVEHPKCDRSQRTTYEKGNYVGTIDLHGEEGYTQVRTSSVPFTLHPFIDFGCGVSIGGETGGQGLPGARLRARAKFGEGEVLELQANQNRPGARVKISVSAEERRDRVRISREASFTYPASAFDFAPNLGTAFLDPPAPFEGSALYRRDAKPANRLTGNLTVDLPGRSNVSLTGARFDSSLVRAEYTE
ncbi:MAG TPA: hypothetical protein VI039_10095 [Solirubrobacterales bacterium]